MLLIGMLLLFGTSQSPDRSPTSVRVYVFTETAASGARTPEEAERLEAVGDVREALRRKKGITIVDTREEANVLVEVTGRERRDEPPGAFGGKSITRMGDTIIRLRVKSGDDETELKGMGLGTWGRAANDAADRFMKWIARREPRRLAAILTGPTCEHC
ncbi:MAG TPA: hypothetical protein VFK57_01665 [Vicinamibacterales bacterium]|nr:hypothetical protein [Vicinamibacterales bacterium]